MNRLYNIVLNLARSVLPAVSNFGLAYLGIKYLGQESWGAFLSILLWVNLAVFVADFGNKDYLIRKYSTDPSKVSSFYYQSLFSRLPLLSFSFALFLFFEPFTALLGFILVVFIFLFQSLNSLVLFYRSFLFQILSEFISFLGIAALFHFQQDFDVNALLLLYIFAYFAKSTLVIFSLKSLWPLKGIQFSIRELRSMFPFFLIGLSGFLASKIDVYLVSIYLSPSALSEYQIFLMAFTMVQALPAMAVYPFLKHVYRLNSDVFSKINRLLFLFAWPTVAIASLGIWTLLHLFLKLNIPNLYYLGGALYALPSYFFILDIFSLYKEKMEKKVVKVNFLAVLVNFVFLLFLIPHWGLDGVLFGSILTQFLILISYKLLNAHKTITPFKGKSLFGF
ncbi:hypothetical protein LAG90_01330 [Marinilongibacter aquaticus]|uniref:hypothetical protein n=1 Tax=Marinilongibacter aquaticus TaxID=2975157 RepID=UPI0021BD22FE|nr:hypothetical protein [Marinilongibacter aquaticus]UBM59298.1 hypothetical protein LAG90_01330 [Marinilongibacter aquaticus]